MPASGKKETMSDAEIEQRHEAAKSHSVYSYRDSGELPARLEDGFDQNLARELLDHAGGDPAHRLLCQSAARRATLLEIAFSWLAREDIDVFWTERTDSGQKVVRMQPILKALGSWHEGLRRDLAELGLTPAAAAKLGVPGDGGVLDAALEDADAKD